MKWIIAVMAAMSVSAVMSVSAHVARPDSTVTTRTIIRQDTVALVDTVVRTRRVVRKDVITRTETVIEEDSVVRRAERSVGVPAIAVCPEGNVPDSPSPDVTQGRDSVAGILTDTNAAGVPLPVAAPGGRFVWIPDSMSASVGRLLSGDASVSASLPEGVDHSERVTFRGDTVKMVLRDRNFGRFDRGLFNYLFIPKGIWQIGVTASYGEFSTSDLEVFELLSDIDISGNMFSIRPYFSYFIGNNMSVGLRLGYNSGRANVDSFNVDIDESMSFNLKDIYYRSESYSAALTFNQYYGLARRGRFGIYNEVELSFSSGNSDFSRPYNGEPKMTHTTTMQAALNFSPGVCVFIMDQVSFNVSFGVFGFSLRNEKQTVDGVEMGNRFTSGANFRFNIFNINFGVAVNL
ncbi:MAG: hypothetical protein K2M27_01910 [Muribaculaceae bacterium]|nr:hypothetical protein [Muribaculaceae bacterium]